MKNLILDAFLLVSRNNSFSHLAIRDFLEQKNNLYIKRYISLTCFLDQNILDLIKNHKSVKLIFQDEKPSSLYHHMKLLTLKSNSHYITFLHDDDRINKNYLIKNYQILDKYFPDALATRFTYINSEGKKLDKRNPKSKNYEKRISILEIMSSYFNPFKQVILTPSLIYRNASLNDYWRNHKKRLGIYEDVRIVYFFASNNFFLNMRSELFSYRINKYQTSSNRSQLPRLRLLKWLKTISSKNLLNLIIYYFFILQYFIFYKRYKSIKLINRIRSSIIKFRIGK